ncbi:MAG: VanZ family protein [bacterium]|nr:VanZ family protein [bacterium]
MNPAKLIKFWLPVLLWALVIFTFSNFPTQKTSEIFWEDFLLKKTAHFIEYAFLFVLIYRALRNTRQGISTGQIVFVALAIVILYASSDEFHQTFILGREGTLRDVLIDTSGALFAGFSLWNLLPKAPEKLKSWAKNFQLI